MENSPKIEMTINDGLDQINLILQECYMRAANSNELPDIMKLREEIQKGEISPEEGVRIARQMVDSKQDYH